MASEAELRDALRRAPDHAPARLALAELLTDTGRAAEAYELLEPLAIRLDADIFILTAMANALKALDRREEALVFCERARVAAPTSGVAEHNLASLLGEMHRFEASKAAVDRAFAKGLDAPETWLVAARTLQGLGNLDAAETAFAEAIRRRPDYADAHGDLAQLIWMRTGDVAAASRALNQAILAHPAASALRMKKAILLEFAGDTAGAYRTLASADGAAQQNWAVQVQLAQYATRLNPAAALGHAQWAFAVQPDQPLVRMTLCQAELASGRADDAARTAQAMCELWPNDQHAIALLATAWRLLGDARYGELYDYERFIGVYELEAPDGWSSQSAFLADLAQALRRLHRYRTHPFGQSVRGGSQTEQSLALSDDPAIQGLFKALKPAIRRHIDGLGRGDDVLRRRILHTYRFAGAWSVELRPHGYHAPHVHQQGWISSACYVDLPPAIDHGEEGWLKFGAPGVATEPALRAEHAVKPAPGRLVLFPSYMWHGTAPFGGTARRLSVAFDLAPV